MAKNKYNRPCPIDKEGINYIDYKNITLLYPFVSRLGKIVPRYYSGATLKNQKMIASAIKRARQMALMRYEGKPHLKKSA